MLKTWLLVGALLFQAPLVTVSMNKEATSFAVAFPADTAIQACLKFESQTQRVTWDGVDQKYTPSSCTLFVDNFKFVEGPDGGVIAFAGPSARTGYDEKFNVPALGAGPWKIWAEIQTEDETWVKSNVLEWDNPADSVPVTPIP